MIFSLTLIFLAILSIFLNSSVKTSLSDIAAVSMLFASENALFGHPEIAFGACPLFFSYMSLVGRGKALELVLNTASRETFIDVQEAYKLNIINKLVENGKVLDEAINMAKKINKSPKLMISILIKVNNAFFDQYKAYETEVQTIMNNMAIMKEI